MRASRTRSTKAPVRSPSLLSLFPAYRKRKHEERAVTQSEGFLGELSEAYLHRGLVLYLGAGVPRSLGLPSWPDLIRSLTVTMMTRRVQSAMDALGGLSEEKYWQTMTAMQEDVEKEADYDKPILMMARAIKDVLGDELPLIVARNLYRHVRRRLFYKAVRVAASRFSGARRSFTRTVFPSSPLLDALVALVRAERDVKGVQAIVNYNYDSLVDEKLRRENVRCVTVRSGHDRVPPGAVPCYHVHGVLPLDVLDRPKPNQRGIGNFVFSEDEYHAEYTDPYKWSNMTQMSLLGRYAGLFVGLSMEDPNIRRLIDVTHRQYPEISNYAILTRKRSLSRSRDSKQGVLRNLFEEVETASFAKIGVRVIWVDTYDKIPQLLNRICRIDDRQ
jgi:SIR2-like domain